LLPFFWTNLEITIIPNRFRRLVPMPTGRIRHRIKEHSLRNFSPKINGMHNSAFLAHG
jgi:hypothetical protein